MMTKKNEQRDTEMPLRELKPEDMHLTYQNPVSWLETVWLALDEHREIQSFEDDERWDDICTAMSWIATSLGIEYDEYGDLVYTREAVDQST